MDNTKNIQFVLSNKDEYEKVKTYHQKKYLFPTKVRSLCDKIEDYMRSPLQIDAEKTLLKKLSIGFVTTLSSCDAIIQELWPSSAVEHLPIWPDLAFLLLVGKI